VDTITTDLAQAAGLGRAQGGALLGILLVVAGCVGVKDSAAPNHLNLVAPFAIFSNNDCFGFLIRN
jgi:hypothetical protein